jgi:hypothetical protein
LAIAPAVWLSRTALGLKAAFGVVVADPAPESLAGLAGRGGALTFRSSRARLHICRPPNGAARGRRIRSERLHEEFKRQIKTQTVLPSAETAARRVDGWQTLATTTIDQPIDLAA